MSEQNNPMITVDAQALAFSINKLEVWAQITAKAAPLSSAYYLAKSVVCEASAELKDIGVPMVGYLEQTSATVRAQAAEYFQTYKEMEAKEAAAKQEPKA